MASSSLIARLLIRTSNLISLRSSQTLPLLLRNNDNSTNHYSIFLRQQQQQRQHASKSYSGGAGKGDSGDDQRRYGSPLRKAGFVRKMVDEGKKETRGSVAFRDVNGKNKDVFQAFDGEGQSEDEEAEDDEAAWEGQHQHPHLAKNNQEPSAFGEQLALAGLTEKDLDSLIAKMDFSGIQGLPPLEEILQHDPEGEQKAKRREMEMRKQQELAMSRVKKVDELGRAYATGRRKTSVARVWLSEGKGRIIINGKTHDMYFPSLDHRVQLLEPFCETQTLGKFNVFSTVKGGGITGQAGALRLGISRALQFYDPELRPPLRANGMLTRDPRCVERKKPGKAKARKSYQWVKR
ncbi:hypothetical protein O6H91_18G085400 [Diphasiastrum complanatum]|uniref:Uncharacterized protein n=1 Tax=Diphasiastrum complanatum TaxID=34168 RepID=A0ACC2B3G6_DIPCM|nr:hypothetical protein O6H91_18G085400 [Diphasiastrum complanatum]